MNDKEILWHGWPGDGSEYYFYADGTYRCPFWRDSQYAEWKLDNGHLLVKHNDTANSSVENNKWYTCLRDDQRHYRVIHDSLVNATIERDMLR
jgi:hypothetical protein